MSPFLRVSLLLSVSLIFSTAARTAPVAAPAFVNTVTFSVDAEDAKHKLVVTTSPSLLRIDIPDEGYSVVYDPKSDFYTGLEHRNYTYWTFSWPEVRGAVEASKRYETRLRDLGNDGLNSSYAESQAQAAGTNAAVTPSVGADDSGYDWHSTTDHKRLAGLDCVRWTGMSPTGDSVEVWATTNPLPQVRAAMEQLRKINEPMALVPVRTVVPPSVFPVYDALVKGGMTPVMITWGSDTEKFHFGFVKAEQREGRPDLFTVPKLYMKTTLITMDGMIQQKDDPGVRQLRDSSGSQ